MLCGSFLNFDLRIFIDILSGIAHNNIDSISLYPANVENMVSS